MLSIGKVKDAAAARSYFEKDNYYLTDKSDREWQGTGVRGLGLTGDIQPEQFEQMLNGTINDEQFIRQREVLAADLTFSVPKSLSIIGIKDTRVIEAHRQAVEQTLKMLEAEFAVTRKGAGGTEKVQSDNLIIAKFHHTTSREQDPQTHTHCVIMNATLSEDGKWRTLDLREIYNNKMYLGQMYRSYLAHNLKELGYQIEAKQKGLFEIKGVDQELMDTLSKRRQQVVSRKEELRAQFPHLGDAELSAMATLDTRRAKEEITGAELVNKWEAEAAQAGYDLHTVWDKTLNQTRSHELGKYEAIKKVVEVLSENESLLTKEQILKGAMELSYTSSPAELERALDYLAVTEGEIVRLDNRTFTTKELKQAELKILELAYGAKDSGDTVSDKYDGTGNTHLSTGQAEASRKILTSKDDLILVQGYAGVGKTTMLQTVKKEAEAAGWIVRGASFTATAAGEMQEIGIQAQTLHSFLLEQHSYNKKQLLIIDEASMVGTKQTLEVLELAKKSGDKVVFLGDTAQLQSISAGRTFRMLQERSGLETIEIKEIKRQRTEEYKELVSKIVAKDTDTVIKELGQAGRLIETKGNMSEALYSAAAEYSDTTLILANSNKERRELNKLIRADLKKNNLVAAEGQQYHIRADARFDGIEKNKAMSYQVGNIVQFSKAAPGVRAGMEAIVSEVDQAKNTIKVLMDNRGSLEAREIELSKYGDKLNTYRLEEIQLAQGDKVIFTKNDKDLQINNGTEASVLSVGQDTLKVKIKDRELEINTKEYPYIDHGYAMTVHKSQGKSVEKVIIVANTQAQNSYNTFYVGVTRGKEELKIITDNAAKLKEQVRHEDSKLNIVEHRKQVYTLER